MSKTIIGLAGPKQSGKTSAALKLEKSGFVRHSFATPLKNMTRSLLMDFGYSFDQVDLYLNSCKELVLPEIGRTTRLLMQTLGTEWGRVQINNDLWVMAARKSLERCEDNLIVFDDVRFENEASMIRELGGLIIHIDRGDLVTDEHASEQGIADHPDDAFVDNDHTLDDFLLDVSIVVAGFMGR